MHLHSRISIVFISIHAPARGATIYLLRFSGRSSISIHAPARGATWMISMMLCVMRFQSTLPQGERRCKRQLKHMAVIFQSTLPQGERPIASYPSMPTSSISIHAPARGATTLNYHRSQKSTFQSTLPQGERHLTISTLNWETTFQSTLPQGERQQSATGLSCSSYFNPRSCLLYTSRCV